MQVNWPAEEPLDDSTMEDLGIYGELLGFETSGLRATSFACVLASSDEPRYAGRMLLLRAADGSAVAIARRAFGRYIVAVHGRAAADLLGEQIRWLREVASSRLDDAQFNPVFLVSPGSAMDGLAIAGARFKDVEHVVSQGADAAFDLVPFSAHRASMQSRSRERITAIESLSGSRPDGFEGLPA